MSMRGESVRTSMRWLLVVYVAGWLSPIGAFAVSSAQDEPGKAAVEMPAYDPSGRRDPFRPYVRFDRPALSGELTPLEQYDLSQLRLVAIVTDERDPSGTRAVVEDGSGLGFIVRVGTAIGRTRGRVSAIERDKIVVEEWPTNVFGEQRQAVTIKELDAGEEAKR